MTTTIADCRLIELRHVPRPQGVITPVEGGVDVPFEIARAYYLYDIPAAVARAGHAHHELEQLLVCIMGSFTVIVRDGREERWVELARANVGLYIPPMIWRELGNFSAGSVCLSLASRHYEESDYLRDFREYAELKAHG